MKSDNQPKNNQRNPAEHLAPFMWRKGQSGNLKGRPRGKTMKEYAKELLECQTEDERQAFLHGLSKDVIWRMAEGNPRQDNTLSNPDGSPITVNIVSFDEYNSPPQPKAE